MTKGGALSAHIGYLFADVPLRARPALAKAAGFDAVEHPAPFAIPARDLRAMLDDLGMTLTQITSGMGNPGEKGIASLPGREAEFRESFRKALDYAEEAGAGFVHAMAGVPAPLDRGAQADATYVENIEAAVQLCSGRKPGLLIETISEVAVPGYHLSGFDPMFTLARDLPDVAILIDTYHSAAVGADPVSVIKRAGASLGHMHFADHPGRNEPGSGTLNFAAILGALVQINYRGAIGFEYTPSGVDHLGWVQKLQDDPGLIRLRSASAGEME